MSVISAANFEKEIKTGTIKNIYYIYGADAGRTGKLAKLLKKKIMGADFSASDYSRFEGKNFDLSEFSDTAEMYPMLTDYNFIEINDFNADNFNADEIKRFLKIIDEIPEQTIILITITGFDVKGGKRTPGAKNKKIIDAFSKKGIVVENEFLKPSEMYKYIQEIASKNGSSINRQNAEKIAEMCLGNTLAAENETCKLSAFAGSEEITAEMIENMISAGIDTNAFALASAVTSFNAMLAMKILDELIQQRAEGVMIISALSSAFIDIYRARIAIDSSIRDNTVAEDFSYKGREFVVRKAFGDARKTSAVHLRKCLKILENADLECKSTRLDQRIIIEKAISEMLLSKNGG